MSTKYQHGDKVPTEVLAKRLDELSDAVVARMKADNARFEREFTCRIPAELDRDADLVLNGAALRLSEQEKRIAELERRILELDVDVITRNLLVIELEEEIAGLEKQNEARLQEAKIKACELDTQKSIVRELINEVGLRVYDYHCISAFKKALAKRDLEMQANALEDFEVNEDIAKEAYYIIRSSLDAKAKQLREQAKGK